MKFLTFFRPLSKITQGHFLLILTCSSQFWQRFFEKSDLLSRITKMKYDHFWDVLGNLISKLKIAKILAWDHQWAVVRISALTSIWPRIFWIFWAILPKARLLNTPSLWNFWRFSEHFQKLSKAIFLLISTCWSYFR